MKEMPEWGAAATAQRDFLSTTQYIHVGLFPFLIYWKNAPWLERSPGSFPSPFQKFVQFVLHKNIVMPQ